MIALPDTGTVAADRVVTSAAVHAPGWVSFERGAITGVGGGRPAVQPDRELGGATLVPGFVDVHVHGGGGAGYTEGSETLARRARAVHLAHGTTTSMASLVTDAPAGLLAGVETLAALVAVGEIRGIHLEGPWLSPARAGAHDPGLLRHPDPAEIDALLRAGSLPAAEQTDAAGGRTGAAQDGGSGATPNAIAMVTIAPELPGALEAIERFVRAGVVVAIGHTDADYERVVRAIDAGAAVATHLFNAMRPLHHREPGPVLALLEDPRVSIELIADGTHLHPALARWAAGRAGEGRALLVTDAMGAAGCGDGAYRLGALDVEVAGGVARVAGTDTIAGSTATMDGLFRRWAGDCAGDAELIDAVRLTAANPARAMGWHDVGDLAVGRRMHAVALDPDLRIVEVLRAG
ncbi:N-acetylglucosamine-6-phosphate deacetylase [Leucobacter sp. UCD-THU]|uniref:N-acetylglucosamine-6-phosphate deacetylase n=1 Tax=Leucobacter sp. UCD-THU TaxID=1292023 RepID=UPI00035F7FF4|nr:amidohydrolase family protein [Leucobacter sp. UCD-THU]